MAKVQFKRYETDLEVQNSDIIDGQFIVTKEGTSYIDYGEDRVATNGTPDIAMSDISQNAVQNKVIKEYVDEKSKEIYSTEEILIGTWLDKPLYRKVVFLNALPNNGTDVRYATGITTNIDYIKMYGKAFNTNTNKTYPLPFVGTNFISWIYDNATNEILITTTNDRSNMIGYAVLEYTKTSD